MSQGNDFGSPTSKGASNKSGSAGSSSGAKGVGSEAASRIGDAAEEATKMTKRAASSLASEANEQVRKLAEKQVGYGADMVTQLAGSVRAAADNLDEGMPPLARIAHDAADRIEGFADQIREQSAMEILETAAGIAKRRPAILLGAAAASGFILYRLLNVSAQSGRYSDQVGSESDEDSEFDEMPGGISSSRPNAGTSTGAGVGGPAQPSTTRTPGGAGYGA